MTTRGPDYFDEQIPPRRAAPVPVSDELGGFLDHAGEGFDPAAEQLTRIQALTGAAAPVRACPGREQDDLDGGLDVDDDGLLAILKAKAARAEQDPDYAADLEEAALAALEDDWIPGEFEDLPELHADATDFMSCSELCADEGDFHHLPEPLADKPDHSAAPDAPSASERGVKRFVATERERRHSWRSFMDEIGSAALDSASTKRWEDRRCGVEFWATLDESLLRFAADDGDADAAAYLGNLYERRYDAEGAMTWYLQSHYGGSELGTVALVRIVYDRGGQDTAAALLASVWKTDTAAISAVFASLSAAPGSSSSARRPRCVDGSPPSVASAHLIVDKIRSGLRQIPPRLPADSFDADVCRRAKAKILLWTPSHRPDETSPDPGLGRHSEPLTRLAGRLSPSTLNAWSDESGADTNPGPKGRRRRLSDDLRNLEAMWSLPEHAREPRQPGAAGSRPELCGTADE
ncbi:hypothetical protein ACPA54_13440 [Uniformispora flossi]|uniref:hypothetical protein n=1 Tax=Uniformispora flossi TaxID=3390723 RepID=UPI003C2BD2AA